jgi:SAM-dependent methyltransferase
MTGANVLAGSFDYDVAWGQWDDMKRYGPSSRHTRRLIMNMVSSLEFRSVLDVGCGQGSPLEEIEERRPGVELAGVDLSEQAVTLARRRLPRASFSVLDLTEGPLDRTFDLIVCSDVLEHIPDDRAALRHIRKMANRWCLVTTLQGRMRRFEREVGHVRNYRRGELRERMEEAGFVVRQQLDWGFPFFSPLYRNVLDVAPSTATTGSYGPGRRVLAEMLYWLFYANLSRLGDYVICLAEVA